MEEVKVTFYKVHACGYYAQRGKDAAFGHLAAILPQLQRWADGKQLAHTKTYEVSDGSSVVPTYLVHLVPHEDTWLLTLWNEVPSNDGKVAAINGQALVGRADVSESEIEEGHIPGVATYFWMLPEQGLIASVRFQHPTTGNIPMNRYLTGFLSSFSEHVVLGEPDGPNEIKIEGYSPDEETPASSYRPKFKSEIYRKTGPVDFIVANSSRIRKIKKKDTLQLHIAPDRSFWQKLLEMVNLDSSRRSELEVKLQYELEINGMTREEIESVVNRWRQEDFQDVGTDYGFVLSGDSKVRWLGHEHAKDTFEFEVVRDNAEIVNPVALLAELARRREQLLGLL